MTGFDCYDPWNWFCPSTNKLWGRAFSDDISKYGAYGRPIPPSLSLYPSRSLFLFYLFICLVLVSNSVWESDRRTLLKTIQYAHLRPSGSNMKISVKRWWNMSIILQRWKKRDSLWVRNVMQCYYETTHTRNRGIFLFSCCQNASTNCINYVLLLREWRKKSGHKYVHEQEFNFSICIFHRPTSSSLTFYSINCVEQSSNIELYHYRAHSTGLQKKLTSPGTHRVLECVYCAFCDLIIPNAFAAQEPTNIYLVGKWRDGY